MDTIAVWMFRTDLSGDVLDGLEMLLDDGERQRAGALTHLADRRRFIAAHGAVRTILGEHLGVPPGLLRWRYEPHGKPVLVGHHVEVSLSHSADLAALALCAGRRVGVDVERMAVDRMDGGLAAARMAARFYPAPEAAFVASASDPAARVDRFTRLWVRKEACVKVAGGRLFPGLREPVLGTRVTSESLVLDLAAPAGFRAALAAAGTVPYRVTRHWRRFTSR